MGGGKPLRRRRASAHGARKLGFARAGAGRHRAPRPPHQMNTRTIALLSLAAAMLAGCSQSGADRAKAELIAADKAFSAQSAKEGPQAAFIEVAASDVKVLSQKSLTGLAAIEADYKGLEPGITLTWEPAYADVSSSGDLGYTWGRYTYVIPRKPK